MNYHKNLLRGIFSVVIIIGFCTTAKGKSVYLVSDTELSNLRAYKISGTSLNYQTQYHCQPSGDGMGAVGLAMNESDYGNFIFVTSEKSSKVDILNAKTMQYLDYAYIYEASDLAGIASDQSCNKIYMMKRYSNRLFSYTWYPLLHLLVSDFSSYIELQDIASDDYKGAFGITLDDINSLLYVGDNTNKIKYYNTSDWSKAGEINVTCNVIGLALDINRRFLYYGSIGEYGQGDPNLYKYNLATGAGQHVFVGSSVVGISVDKDTGYVYITTFGDGNTSTQSRIIIYDSNLVKQSYDSGNIGNPAGILVPSGNIEYKPPSFTFAKIDVNSPNSVVPGNYITYRITYGPNGVSHNNVVITDFLPGEVNFLNPSSDPNYNASKHTYTWRKGNISAGAANNSVDINVQVNNGADPNGVITNFCEIESDVAYNTATASTNVGSWEPNSNIIYVDFLSLCSPGTGVSWRYAYRNLQDALDNAATGRGSQIWVAHGIYQPRAFDQTFTVYKGIPVYGHFAGNETTLSQRNLNDPNNQSILTEFGLSLPYVVFISNGDSGNYIDGFTIRGALIAGVLLEDANLYIANCLLTANDTGILSYDSNFTVFNCNITNSGYAGINAFGSHFTVSNSLIQNNGYYGIYANLQNTPNVYKTSVKNNIIRNSLNYNGAGIFLQNVNSPVDILNNLINNNYNGIVFVAYSGSDPNLTVQNNTIVNNTSEGIFTFVSSPSPIIRNCILWGNSEEIYSSGYTVSLTYCCIEGGFSGPNNISSDPCFVKPDTNDFHLKYASLCIDAGDPNADYSGQTDIDGQPRVMLGQSHTRVDIGADEFLKADFNGDSIVNFIDFAILAAVWKSTNSPSISLDDDNDVDINDLKLFCNNWLMYAPCFPLYEMLAEQSEEESGMAAGIEESMELVGQTLITESDKEPVTNESSVAEETTEGISEPVSDEQIQLMIDWLEQIWQTDPELQEMIDPNDYQNFIDSLREELND